MLKFLIDSVEDYYYIYGIVERFVLLFDELSYVENLTPTRLAEIKDKAKERLSALISEDDNLSQNTLSKDTTSLRRSSSKTRQTRIPTRLDLTDMTI